jgi:hypothetical protein
MIGQSSFFKHFLESDEAFDASVVPFSSEATNKLHAQWVGKLQDWQKKHPSNHFDG